MSDPAASNLARKPTFGAKGLSDGDNGHDVSKAQPTRVNAEDRASEHKIDVGRDRPPSSSPAAALTTVRTRGTRNRFVGQPSG